MLATRAELRPKIAEGYSFARHAVLLHVFALGAIAASLAFVRDLRWVELATAPAAFVFANLVEYVFHRYPMHHRWPLLGFMFSRHTVHHHAYFRVDSMKVADARDMRYVLFPALAGLGVLAVGGVGGALVALWSWNAGLLFVATTSFYYLLYEWFHASFHLLPEETLARIPVLRAAARRHRLHHDPARMTQINYAITFAIFDRVFGTLSDT